MIRLAVAVGWRTAVWVALWRDLSWANVASGVLVSLALVAVFPLGPDVAGLRFRPLVLARFAATVAWSVAKANAVVAWEVVTPRNRINEAVVAVRTSTDHPVVITLVSHAIGLAPGTMVVDVSHEPTTLYVHVLHLRDVESVRADVARLERLVCRAVGADPARGAAA